MDAKGDNVQKQGESSDLNGKVRWNQTEDRKQKNCQGEEETKNGK